MARTRTQIKALAVLNTGRSDKDTLMNSICDTALKIAVAKHPFHDIVKLCDDITITEDNTTVDISAPEVSSVAITDDIYDLVTARIVEASGTRNYLLPLTNRQWWDENVINPEDNNKGWPVVGLKVGTNLHLDRPAESNLELRLRLSTIPTFASDATECPIKVLDIFVEQYVTAMTYLSLGQRDEYVSWYIMALGRRYDQGEVGGTLLQAVNSDKGDTAERKYVSRGAGAMNLGTAFTNNTQFYGVNGDIANARYGETHTWY